MNPRNRKEPTIQSLTIEPDPSTQLQIETTTPRVLKKLDVANDHIAILLHKVTAKGLELGEGDKYMNEGIVIGVGPGVTNGVKVGDEVVIGRMRIDQLSPKKGVYAGQTIAIIPPIAVEIWRVRQHPGYIFNDQNCDEAR